MNANAWLALVRQTFLDPFAAAGTVIALRRGVTSQSLWSAVILVAVLNALVISLGLWLMPPPPGELALFPRFFFRPGLLAVFAAGAIVIMVFALHWAGRALGGAGDLRDMLAVISWLQLVQVGVQLVVLAVALVALPLAGLVNFAAFLWGMWILIAFVDRVHGFNNPLKVLAVLALTLGLLLVGLMIFALLMGVTGEGAMPNV